MAAEDAGRRAGRVEQDRVDRRRRLPAHHVGGDHLRGEAGARQILAKVAPDDFPRYRPRSPPSRRAASCIVLPPGAAQRSSAVRPSPGAEQPRRERGGDVLHPPVALAIAGSPATAVPRGEAEMARHQADPRRASARRRRAKSGRSAAARRSACAAAATTSSPQASRQRSATARGQRAARRAAPHFCRITVLNTPWTSLRGPPSTSGRTVEIAAWCGVPSASAWTSAMRSAKRALASSGRRLLRRAVDQRVEIGQAAQRLGGDGVGEGAVVGAVEVAGGGVERGFERQALAQHRIEQAQGGAARRRAGRIGAPPPAHLAFRAIAAEMRRSVPAYSNGIAAWPNARPM